MPGKIQVPDALQVEVINWSNAIQVSYTFTNTTDADVVVFDQPINQAPTPGIDGIGRSESRADYARFITSSFSSPTDKWRICSWHKKQNRMQSGDKDDETGWAVFESCLNVGALVAMGHEGANSRTPLLKRFLKPEHRAQTR